MQKQECSRRDDDDSAEELSAFHLALLFAEEQLGVWMVVPAIDIVLLTKMELAHNVQVVLDDRHVLHEFRQQLHKPLQLEADSPALRADDLVEQVPAIV